MRNELEQMLREPILLAPNTFVHFYNGGKLRAEFMCEDNPHDDFRSEEWIFSTNLAITPGRENPLNKGLSLVAFPNGKIGLLKELLEEFPEETLGKKHYRKYGANLGVLLKILDVGERAHIPVHWHPSPEFASQHLNSSYGKNEAWMVIGTRPAAKAWIGWKDNISKNQFREWIEQNNVEAVRSCMHEVNPKVGEVLYINAGIVHSINSGLCILEIQEPTDWSILAEWEGFPYDKKDGLLGLDLDTALEAAEFTRMPLNYLDNYIKREPRLKRELDGNRDEEFLPEEAKRYFWLNRLTIETTMEMPNNRGFYCAVTTQGEGKIAGPFGQKPIKRGQSFFITASLPPIRFTNLGKTPLEVFCCYPPAS